MLITDVHDSSTKYQIMRDMLCDAEYENIQWSDIYDILMDGCQGYRNMSDEEIEDLYEIHFDEPFDSEK
jgi:hypothetical protein